MIISVNYYQRFSSYKVSYCFVSPLNPSHNNCISRKISTHFVKLFENLSVSGNKILSDPVYPCVEILHDAPNNYVHLYIVISFMIIIRHLHEHTI